ncbi:MAG: hypothetical protein QOF14_1195 [Hyphomicrobiales bacterium]|jgi:hypothetical protein|nr:hypothetical protein [Hyphomicrobiales bacterium]
MLTKTKIALAAALVAVTSNAAFAQSFDPNMSNRYPHYADPEVYGYMPNGNAPQLMHPAPVPSMQSAPVSHHQDGHEGLDSRMKTHTP